jgi:hypothetical protein
MRIARLATAVVLAVAACGGNEAATADERTIFEDGARAGDSEHIVVVDDGDGISIKGEPDAADELRDMGINVDNLPSAGAQISDIEAAFEVLEVPESVLLQISRTRALDGTQDATWTASNDTIIEASWTYHPDSGLNFIAGAGP